MPFDKGINGIQWGKESCFFSARVYMCTYVCVCVCVCVCIYIYIHNIYICVYTHTHTHMHTKSRSQKMQKPYYEVKIILQSSLKET